MVVTDVCTRPPGDDSKVAERQSRRPTGYVTSPCRDDDGHRRPVSGHADRAIPIGAPYRDAPTLQPRERCRRWMAVVVASHRNDRRERAERIEQLFTGTAAAAVVAHLEQIHLPQPPAQMALGWKPGVAGEERLEVSVLHQEHHRILVHVLAPLAPPRFGMEHREAHAVEREVLARAGRMPGDAVAVERGEQRGISRIGAPARQARAAIPPGIGPAGREPRPGGRRGHGRRRWRPASRRPAAPGTAPPPCAPHRGARRPAPHRSRSSGRPACEVPHRRPAPRRENVTRGLHRRQATDTGWCHARAQATAPR